jgi:hypothetical protein
LASKPFTVRYRLPYVSSRNPYVRLRRAALSASHPTPQTSRYDSFVHSLPPPPPAVNAGHLHHKRVIMTRSCVVPTVPHRTAHHKRVITTRLCVLCHHHHRRPTPHHKRVLMTRLCVHVTMPQRGYVSGERQRLTTPRVANATYPFSFSFWVGYFFGFKLHHCIP